MTALIRFGVRPTHANHDRFIRKVMAHPDRAAAQWGDRWSAFGGYDIELSRDEDVSRATGQLLRRVALRTIPREQLAGITVPVAMIWGTGDHLMRFRIAQRAVDRLGWPLHPIADCGHGPHIERPGAFVEALEEAMAA